MLNFKLFIENKGPHKYSCVMAVIENPEKILKFGKKISNDDIYTPEGRELDPHVTALYGLHTDDPEEIKPIISKFNKLSATLGAISKFSNKPEYDVLKLNVKSDDLHALNKALKKLPYTSDYPDYEPHVTIAYVKKGHCEDLLKDKTFEGYKLNFKTLIFSTADKKKFKLSLS